MTKLNTHAGAEFDWVTERAVIMPIQPHVAGEFLKRNVNNRRLNSSRVTRLAAKIMAGKFIYNGQSISFDSNGVLLDGQHRLAAIEESGVACRALVAFGISPSATHTQDVGEKRCLSEQSRRDGRVPRPDLVTAWFKQYELFCTGSHASDADAQELAQWYAKRASSVDWLTSTAVKSRLFRSGVCAVFLRAHETYPKQTERFVDRYKRGEGLRAGDPELALRESAARLVASGGNTASEEGRRVAYALESARLGRSMSRAFSSDASLRALFGRDEL